MIKDTSDFNEDSSGNHGIADTTPDIHIDPRAVSGSGQAGFGKPVLSSGSSLGETAHDTWSESRVSDDTENDWSDGGAVTRRDYQGLKTEPDVANVRTEQDFANLNIQPDAQSANTEPDLEPNANQVTNWDPIDYSKPKNSGAHAVKTQGDPPSASKAGSSSASSKPIDQRIGPVSRIQIGEMFANKYEITGHIGRGGMGTVYKAVDLVLGRTVAIKFLRTTRGINQKEVSRFQQEAKAIASLDHHNIIRVHEMSVTAEGEPFFVLEYISGNSLSTEIKLTKGLSVERSITITMQICDALQHAHDHGVVHRDLKPSNLMIVKSGETEVVKLLDFGIAKRNPIDEQTLLKLTKTGDLFGSPHYMSPEQCEGKAVNTPSDIYSLGIVLFEMLTGKPPFSGNTLLATLDMHKTAATPTVTGKVDEETAKLLDPILSKMLAKNPDDRFARPADVKAALQTLLHPAKQDEPKDAQSLLKKYFPHGIKDARGRKNAALAALSAVCLIGGGAAISFLVQNALAPNMMAKEVDKTPWSTYDYKGQKMFDVGNYKDANVFFHRAYEKALSLEEPKRTALANRSLREIKMVALVCNDQKKVDWANRQLLDYAIEVPNSVSPVSEDIIRNIDVAIKKDNVVELQQCLDRLHVQLPELRKQGFGLHEYLASLETRLSERPSLVASRAYVQLMRAGLQIASNHEISMSTNPTIIAVSSMTDVTPLQAYLAAEVGLRSGCPVQTVRGLLDTARANGNAEIKRKTEFLLSQLFWNSGQKIAAIKLLEDELDRLERRKDIRFAWIYPVITNLAWMYHNQSESARALPLLLRGKAIAACETDFVVDTVSTTESVNYKLVFVLASLKRFAEAKELMSSMESGSLAGGPTSEQRVRWLAHYGHLLTLALDFDQAESYLNQAKAILLEQNRPTSESDFLLKQVTSDLLVVERGG